MNKEFVKEYIEWYQDRSQMPGAVNEVVLTRLYNKAIQISINEERDGASYKRVIEEYGLKPIKTREKPIKNG